MTYLDFRVIIVKILGVHFSRVHASVDLHSFNLLPGQETSHDSLRLDDIPQLVRRDFG